MDNIWETILKASTEGGSISLLAKNHDGNNIEYKYQINEMIYEWLDDEKSIAKSGQGIKKAALKLFSWEEGINSINSYPWQEFYPRIVHRDFRIRVWKEILKYDRKVPYKSIWLKLCFPDNSEIGEAAEMVMNSNYTVVLTGAGISTESGIPDFRSKVGWWNKINPSSVANIKAINENYKLFWEFYKFRLLSLDNVKPNTGHEILFEWEKRGIIKSIITQNVNGLHRIAGNDTVYELHGSIRTVRCNSCGKPGLLEDFINNGQCIQCGGKLRPNVVLFGEGLPETIWEKALAEVRKAELIIVIGTSLNVGPVNRLPFLTHARKLLINMEVTEFEKEFDIVLKDKAGKALEAINQILI